MVEHNPFEPPESVVDDVFQAGEAGGSLAAGIAGDYDFRVMDVVGEAWRRTRGVKRAYWGGMLVLLLVVVTTGLLLGGLGMVGGQRGAGQQLLVEGLLTAAIYPFLAGIIMMGVYRAVDLPVSAGMVFESLNRTGAIVVASVLVSLLTNLGFMLLVLPGVYLWVAWSLVIPLIVDKNLGPWRAMEASRKAITRHWFKVFGVMVVMGGLLIVAALTVIGLFWILPMSSVLMGVLYRIIFGVEKARRQPTEVAMAA